MNAYDKLYYQFVISELKLLAYELGDDEVSIKKVMALIANIEANLRKDN